MQHNIRELTQDLALLRYELNTLKKSENPAPESPEVIDNVATQP
jgi:hypothetical protein